MMSRPGCRLGGQVPEGGEKKGGKGGGGPVGPVLFAGARTSSSPPRRHPAAPAMPENTSRCASCCCAVLVPTTSRDACIRVLCVVTLLGLGQQSRAITVFPLVSACQKDESQPAPVRDSAPPACYWRRLVLNSRGGSSSAARKHSTHTTSRRCSRGSNAKK